MKKFNLKKMKRETHIPIISIKASLDIPFEEGNFFIPKTLLGTQEAWFVAKKGSEERIFLFKKLLGFVNTIDEIKDVYEIVSPDSLEETLTLKKWLELVTTLDEANDFFKNTRANSYEQTLAIRKIASFYNWAP